MSATLFGLAGALMGGIGIHGLILDPRPLRKILAFNVLGAGVFLVFGAIAGRGAASGFSSDPVPQALVLTGIVVAFAATALAVTLLLRLEQADPQVPHAVRADVEDDVAGPEGEGV